MAPMCIITDPKRCIACYACVAHCKTKNAVAERVFLSRVVSTGPKMEQGRCAMVSEFQSCYHCEQAWCMQICPSGAVKRDDVGTVLIDSALCIGCGLCAKACPWDMVKMVKISNDDGMKTKRLAVKCDHCRDLYCEDGLEGTYGEMQPACVTACTAHALQFVPLCDAPKEYQEAYNNRIKKAWPKAEAFVSKMLDRRKKDVYIMRPQRQGLDRSTE